MHREQWERGSRGFTLIELLVVLVIIGIITSMAALAIRDGRADELKHEADRLAAVLSLAADDAVLKSRPLGIRLQSNGYEFMQPDADGNWQTLDGDRELSPHELPEPMELEFLVEGQTAKQSDKPLPHAVFFQTSEALPFEVDIRYPDLERFYRIKVEINGRIALSAQE